MRKRRLFLLGIVGLVLMVVWLIVSGVFREREPEYGGKRLSEWVLAYADYASPTSDYQQIDDAIQHIGTNAIPYLLDWIKYEPPKSKTNRLARINSLLAKIHRGLGLPDMELIRGDWAVVALTRLRPQTDEYIRELRRLATDPKSTYGAPHAIEVLAGLGEPGLAPLLTTLTNGPVLWRGLVIRRLGSMGSNAIPAVTALQQFLSDPDRNIRVRATNTLRKIDPKALERGDGQ